MPAHGEIKLRIAKAILAHESFTTQQLCDWTGLKTEQVYPHLAKLIRNKILRAEPHTSAEDQRRPPHRPISLYQLSSDPKKRRKLAREIEPFVKWASTKFSVEESEAFVRAHAELDLIDSRLASCEATCDFTPRPADLEKMEKSLIPRLEAALKSAKKDIEIAFYEAGADETTSAGKLVNSELDRLEHYDRLFASMKIKLSARKAVLNAEETYSKIVSRQLKKLLVGVKTRGVRNSLVGLEEEYGRAADQVYVADAISQTLVKLKHLEDPSPNPVSEVRLALASSCMKFGASPRLCASFIEDLDDKEKSDPLTLYNSVSLFAASGQPQKAEHQWLEFVEKGLSREHWGGSRYADLYYWFDPNRERFYKYMIVIKGNVEELSVERLTEVRRALGLSGAISIASAVHLPKLGLELYEVKPTLIDWCSPEPQGFLFSHSIQARVSNLFAYGPLARKVGLPGVPVVRLSVGLVFFGCSAEQAWRIAAQLNRSKSLLLLHRQDRWEESAIQQIRDALPSFEIEERVDIIGEKAAARAAGAGE